MGFIISEKGFEMTPGSREIDTPGIWRQDGAVPGDLFASSFANIYNSAEPATPEEKAENMENKIKKKQNRAQKQYGKWAKSFSQGNTQKSERIANRLKATTTKITNKKTKLNKYKTKHKIK